MPTSVTHDCHVSTLPIVPALTRADTGRHAIESRAESANCAVRRWNNSRVTGNDVLVFAGPIVLAIVALVGPFVAMKLRLRDARERIRADLELVDKLPDEWPGRASLIESINYRLNILATQSIPNAFRRDYYHANYRRNAIVARVFGVVVGIGGYMGLFLASTPLGSAGYGVVALLGFGSFGVGYSWLNEANTKIRDRLIAEQDARSLPKPPTTEQPETQ